MRFLFTTLQDVESDFYGRASDELRRRGHEVTHVTYSRLAAKKLSRRGFRTHVLPDEMAAVPDSTDWEHEGERIAQQYELPTLRDVWKTDPLNAGRSERECLERTVRTFVAIERVFDDVKPEFVVPEVGSETMRTATHAIGIERGATVFFLFYTIFPNALRLYANTIHAPVVPQEEVRELTAEEGEEIDAFIERAKAKAKPTRPYRDAKSRPWIGWKVVARHLWTQVYDRNNEYMQPIPWFLKRRRERMRGILARRFYQPLREGRKTVYFPLHVTDDYKIKRVIPHCVDQASLIEQIADSLPHGYDVVLKEHPMSIGRNSLKLLARLRRIPNVRIVDPFMSSHELMKNSEAIYVISSTVGLEAMMYGKPVMTLGQPFYSGYGLTVDVDSFSEIRAKVPATLEFKPDPERVRRFLHAASRRCYASDPFIVDFSDENARNLADSLETAARERSAAGPQDAPAVTSPPDHAAAAITGTP